MKFYIRIRNLSTLEDNLNHQSKMKVGYLRLKDHATIMENPVITIQIAHCLRKTKIVSHAKYDHVDKMSHVELLNAFDNIQNEAKEDFKRLASNKIFFFIS